MRAVASLLVVSMYFSSFCYELIKHRPWEPWLKTGNAVVEQKEVLQTFDGFQISTVNRRPVGILQSSTTSLRFEAAGKQNIPQQKQSAGVHALQSSLSGPLPSVFIDLSKEDVKALIRAVALLQSSADERNGQVVIDLTPAGTRVQRMQLSGAISSPRPLELIIEGYEADLPWKLDALQKFLERTVGELK